MTLQLKSEKISWVTQPIEYPDSDGQPMADNTLQFRYIVTIKEGLEAVLADTEVFVAGDLLWYPVEGNNTLRQAPDVLVAFGRPKGERGSYMQWKEGHVAPQVVFEVLSPGNKKAEMARKFEFYDRYGVEEYYIYDPDRGRLNGWLRDGGSILTPIVRMDGWVSPRLGVRFELVGTELRLYGPDGERFLSFQELVQKRRQAEIQVKAEAQARRQAEIQVKAETQARRQAEIQVEIEAQARRQAEAQLAAVMAELEQLKRLSRSS